MKWVLIYWVLFVGSHRGGVATNSIEFLDKRSCEVALSSLQKLPKKSYLDEVHGVCVENGI
jgi:hypothetical protein